MLLSENNREHVVILPIRPLNTIDYDLDPPSCAQPTYGRKTYGLSVSPENSDRLFSFINLCIECKMQHKNIKFIVREYDYALWSGARCVLPGIR